MTLWTRPASVIRLAALAVAAMPVACGGLIAAEPDAGDAGADVEDAGPYFPPDAMPYVTSVTPSRGPNVGGTHIVVRGGGFAPGDSVVTLADVPLAEQSCKSTIECEGVTPFPNLQDFDQVLDVRVTAHVSESDAGTLRSAITPRDQFTYLAGPPCKFQLSCQNAIAYPDMVITCPQAVTFYSLSNSLPDMALATAATYTAGTEDFYTGLVACYGGAHDSSCSTYVSKSNPWDCGGAAFCATCKKLGGVCINTSPPQCWK